MTTHSADQAISKLAARQHGLVTRAQVLSLGMKAACLDGRVRSRRFRSIQRGVYRVGPASAHEAVMAAVLSCGGAVASHRSAGFLWDVVPCPEIVEIIVRRDHGYRPRMRAHHDMLAADEVTEVEGIPTTDLPRTLLDLSSVLDRRGLEQALAQAERAGLEGSVVSERMDRYRGRPGVRQLRALLARGQPALTRSEAEERFLALIRTAELPPPETNVLVAGHEVDFAWGRARVVVEVDGFAFHSSPDRFENDRRRDARLAAHGFLVMRVTWRHLTHQPEAALVRLAQALAVRESEGTPARDVDRRAEGLAC